MKIGFPKYPVVELYIAVAVGIVCILIIMFIGKKLREKYSKPETQEKLLVAELAIVPLVGFINPYAGVIFSVLYFFIIITMAGFVKFMEDKLGKKATFVLPYKKLKVYFIVAPIIQLLIIYFLL